jgi:hypothetical protein
VATDVTRVEGNAVQEMDKLASERALNGQRRIERSALGHELAEAAEDVLEEVSFGATTKETLEVPCA